MRGVSFAHLPAGPAGAGLAQDAINGLAGRPKSLPPKYFYDARGSTLFERICATPEYYPARTEDALLARVSAAVIGSARPQVIVELGSGSSRKTRHLFEACAAQRRRVLYRPLDVCGEALRCAARRLVEGFPWLRIEGLIGDYAEGLAAIPLAGGPRLFVSLGGTLGNFTDAQAADFLARLRARMGRGDALLVGFDRVKDKGVLDAAYNDAGGLTAAFNLNLLTVLNRELGGDFDCEGFRHAAFFRVDCRRIEMHLVAQSAQKVRLRRIGMTVELERGESILTEISRKFTADDVENLLGRAGFVIVRHDEAAHAHYSLVLAAPKPGTP